MRRREFIGLLGGVAGALTCADVFAAQKSPIGPDRLGDPSSSVVHPGVQIVFAATRSRVLAPIRFACARLARRREFADRVALKTR